VAFLNPFSSFVFCFFQRKMEFVLRDLNEPRKHFNAVDSVDNNTPLRLRLHTTSFMIAKFVPFVNWLLWGYHGMINREKLDRSILGTTRLCDCHSINILNSIILPVEQFNTTHNDIIYC
jgi:hypothetical protein